MTSTTSSRPMASTPPTLSPSSDQPPSDHAPSVSRLHILEPPPPSPSPFMKAFVATAHPPPTAVEAIRSTSTTSRFWQKRTARVRRVHMLVALTIAVVVLLSATGSMAMLSAALLRHRFQHDESFAHPPRDPIYPVHTPNYVPPLHPRHERIGRRQVSNSTSLDPQASSTPTPTPTPTAPTSTLASPATAHPIPTNSPPLPTPFPQPFDDTLTGADFVTGSCQQFFTGFTNDIDFRSCRAFSFLYPASEAFLNLLEPTGNATDPLQGLNNVLWGTCNTTTDEATCTSRMNDYESQLQLACKVELSQGEALAVTALNGFRNFNLMRTTACLANQRTGSYCFVDAVAASDNGAPSDIYFYQLPLGTPLPGAGTQGGITISATCSTCVRSLMSAYSQYIPKANGGGGLNNGTDLLIQSTYESASDFVSKQCGTGYASVISVSSAATPTRKGVEWSRAPLLLWMIGVLFLWREGG